jgi:hypothetical protein
MSTLAVEIVEARAQDVETDEDRLIVDLTDGRTIIAPLAWYPRLWHGKPQERVHYEIIGDGAYIHWPDLDEDLSVAGILAGRRSGESPASLQQWLDGRK